MEDSPDSEAGGKHPACRDNGLRAQRLVLAPRHLEVAARRFPREKMRGPFPLLAVNFILVEDFEQATRINIPLYMSCQSASSLSFGQPWYELVSSPMAAWNFRLSYLTR